LHNERAEPVYFSETGLGKREGITASIAVVWQAFDDPAPI
jgi:hypothetical protein